MIEHRACPCLHTTPCHDRCACVHIESSFACRRCCSQGNTQQQRKMSEHLAALIDGRIIRVGVAAIVRVGSVILMGKRKGSHGAGTWSFPGGHLEDETAGECAARELEEEAGLIVMPSKFRKLTFTNDVFQVEQKHYITLYMETTLPGTTTPEVFVKEPNKCDGWGWFSAAPSPLFLPVQNLLADGFQLWR